MVLEVGFDLTLVVRVLDMVGDGKDGSDAVLGFVVEGVTTEGDEVVIAEIDTPSELDDWLDVRTAGLRAALEVCKTWAI